MPTYLDVCPLCGAAHADICHILLLCDGTARQYGEWITATGTPMYARTADNWASVRAYLFAHRLSLTQESVAMAQYRENCVCEAIILAVRELCRH